MKKLNLIMSELREHIPFTIFGAGTAILFIILFRKISFETSYQIFYILHPVHVLLSALVTSSIFKNYNTRSGYNRNNLWLLILVGFLGSIGISTLSDSLIPYLGEYLLDLPHRGVHLGFIEKWWLVNPLAFLGIAIAYYKPATKFPHGGHVLLSTWASLFHIMMALDSIVNWLTYLFIFLFLFLAVWLPCCFSDIVFPLLFIKNPEKESVDSNSKHSHE